MLFTKDDFGQILNGVFPPQPTRLKEGIVDGKGPSIWDVFVKQRRKIANNEHGNVACDFYNRYADDIVLMYKMAFPITVFHSMEPYIAARYWPD